MKDLKNHEFEGVYCDIIKLIDSKRVDDTNIQLAFTRIKSHVKNFDALRKPQRNKHSILNKELTLRRTDYLISLRLRVQSYMRSHLPEERVAAKLINSILGIYGKKYYVPTIVTQTTLVHDIVIYKEQNKGFKEAFALLGLTGLIDTIIEMTEEIMNNLNLRISENGANKKRKSGVRKVAYKDMKVLIDTINLMYVINIDNKEKRVIAENLMWDINSIFKDYRTPMRSRHTKRKNRNAVDAAVNELIKTQHEQQKTLPVGASKKLETNGTGEPTLHAKERIGTTEPAPSLKREINDLITSKYKVSFTAKKDKDKKAT